MAREFSRTDRVGSQIRRELAALIIEALDDPRLGMLTIQEVRVSKDFSHAKVFYTSMGGSLAMGEINGILKDAASFFRHELGQRLKLRGIPELHFYYDESVEKGEKLSSLIEEAVQSDAAKHRE
ncbi:MAG: 30S ribosome-binding factor RbfA [Gammaproteobacteria bacterium]|nr:30S ribosome-binding factor RbfA [Gammaproteobacteria bacterium]